MPLASSSFLRVSSHWVNCFDSRNICNQTSQESVGFFCLQNNVTKINLYTILLYSSKSFFTSCDWVSIWSWKESNVESEVDKKQRGESDDDRLVHFYILPALWCESATAAAVWWRVLAHLWMTDNTAEILKKEPAEGNTLMGNMISGSWHAQTLAEEVSVKQKQKPKGRKEKCGCKSHLWCRCCPVAAACCWPAPAEQPGTAGTPPLGTKHKNGFLKWISAGLCWTGSWALGTSCFLPAKMNSSFMVSGTVMWSVNWGSRYFSRSSTVGKTQPHTHACRQESALNRIDVLFAHHINVKVKKRNSEK